MSLAANGRYKIRVQMAQAATKRKTTSLASFQEMKHMEVEHVLATKSVVAWATCCWIIELVKRKDSGSTVKGKVSYNIRVFGMKWPRYDVIVSPDCRNMNLKETYLDVNVKNDEYVVQRDMPQNLGGETRMYTDERRIVARTDKSGSDKEQK